MLSIINIIIVVLIIALTLLAHFKGSRILLTAIIGFYPTAMIYAAIPDTTKKDLLFFGTTGASLFYSHLFVFAVIFTLVFLIVIRIMQNEGLSFGIQKWVNAILISTSFVLLLVALSFHILPAYDIFQFGTKAQNFWTSSNGYLLSIIAPLLVIWKVSKRV